MIDTVAIKKMRCDDCKHFIGEHDYMGCVLRGCKCRLSSLFLIEYNGGKVDVS